MNDAQQYLSHGSLTLFLMTAKGYHFLRHTVPKYKSLFGLVVVANDTAIQKDYETEILDFCLQHGIPCVKRNDLEIVETEYALAISWRWLIKHPIDKIIVLHDSLLPKYRGFAPLVNALINGEPQVGVSAIFGANDFDTGDIITQSKSSISYPIKINEAISIVNKNYLDCAETVLKTLLDGKKLKADPQNESLASYSVWRDEFDYAIDWSNSSSEIRRFVDAVGYPYKGAYTKLDGRVVRILSAEEAPDVTVENRHYGKVLFVDDGKPVVICGTGLLKIHDAVLEQDNQITPLLPLPKFRIRFTT